MVRVAQAADAAGFLYVAVCHHVAIPREPAEIDVDAVVRPDRDARLPRRAHHAHPLDDATCSSPRTSTRSSTAKAVRHARHAVERTRDRRHRRRSRRRRVRRARACRSRGAARSPTTRSTTIKDTLDERVDRRRGPAPAAGAAAASADLDRRIGQARAAARRARRPTAGSRRRRRSTSSPTTSTRSCASATRCGPARCPRSVTTSSRTSVSRPGSCRRA